MVPKVIYHWRQICKGLQQECSSAVLDLASRFHKSLSELVTLTFSEKKSRKLLLSLVGLFCTSNMLLFSRQQGQETVLLPSNTVLPALHCEPPGGSKGEQYLVRPCVLFGGCYQVHLPPSLSVQTSLCHIHLAAWAVVYMSLQCYKREFLRNCLVNFLIFCVLYLAGGYFVFCLCCSAAPILPFPSARSWPVLFGHSPCLSWYDTRSLLQPLPTPSLYPAYSWPYLLLLWQDSCSLLPTFALASLLGACRSRDSQVPCVCLTLQIISSDPQLSFRYLLN